LLPKNQNRIANTRNTPPADEQEALGIAEPILRRIAEAAPHPIANFFISTLLLLLS